MGAFLLAILSILSNTDTPLELDSDLDNDDLYSF
jgi:hypothetical protein